MREADKMPNLRMHKVALYGLFSSVLLASTAYASGPIHFANEIDEIIVSPDASHFAVYSEARHELVVAGAVSHKIAIPKAINIRALAWSPDSKYISIEYETSDDYSALMLVDLKKMGTTSELKFAGKGFSVRWFGSGHSLIIVPLYGASSERQDTPGLIKLDARTMEAHTILGKYYFTGKLDVGGERVAAQVFVKEGKGERYSILFAPIP